MVIKVHSDRIKEKMLINGFSQRSLARAAELSDTTVNHVINGLRNPSPATAKKICDALDCGFDDIFFIEKDNKSYQSAHSA